MKKTFSVIAALFCNSLLASDDAFIKAYDASKYSEAASLIEHVNVSNIEVARRLGVMYYEGRGIISNQPKGVELLEDAMEKGCVQSAINLVKIYFRIEKNIPKASRCLLEAEKCNNEAFKDEIEKLKTLLGSQYQEGLVTYIRQLRGMLEEEYTMSQEARGKLEAELIKSRMICERNLQLENELKEIKALYSEINEQWQMYDVKIKDKERKIEEEMEKLKGQVSIEVDAKSQLEQKLKDAKSSNENLELQLKIERGKMTPRKRAEYYQRLIEELDVNYEAISIDKEIVPRDEIYQRYNELARKHNKLVQKYNRLIKAIDDDAVQENESDDDQL